ncbi:hypothetical protein [Clostridium beijerinckii]|uniref:hypothetical protein n=1 Tax=Clostridium beijerinckii TaxID=1520 RepID=UPI001F4BDFB5|nr:hypothetical protein [Clostridium beijerinckii]NRT75513.1 hypothetical protein [Clostridium beijerinckii]
MHIRDKEWNVLAQHISRPNNDRDLEIYRLYIDTWNKEERKLKYNELPENLITHNIQSHF